MKAHLVDFLPFEVADYLEGKAFAASSMLVVGTAGSGKSRLLTALVTTTGTRLGLAGLSDLRATLPCLYDHDRSFSLHVPRYLESPDADLAHLLNRQAVQVVIADDPSDQTWSVLSEVAMSRTYRSPVDPERRPRGESWSVMTDITILRGPYDSAVTDDPAAEYPGDPRHRDHEEYLLALGRATYQAALLSGTCYDILRVWAGHEGGPLERKDLGQLQQSLQAAGAKTTGVEGELGAIERFEEFMTALDHARELRNDLLHALPTMHGLQRRGSKVIVVEGGVWTFHTPERVDDVTEVISLAARLGNNVLYADNGDRVEAWSAQQRAS